MRPSFSSAAIPEEGRRLFDYFVGRVRGRHAPVASGIFGADMKEDTIPLEAGIEGRAISTSKGCYVGQEVIIRVLHRGHGRVARHLVGLAIDGPVVPTGAPILAGDREVGRVTSAAVSPRAGTVALGYVHRDFVAPGTALAVGETSLVAQVRPL